MASNIKLIIQAMQEIARTRGGECLSEEYGNWDAKLLWRCALGHEWENRAGKVKSGQWCPTCAGKSPKGMAYLHDLAAQKGGQCLSTVYPGMQNLAVWRCERGHEWQAKPNNIRYGGWCPYCLGKYQTLNDMHELARSRGGECLSDEYLGQATKLVWRCSDNHIWKAVPNAIKNGGWCPHCRVNYGEEICRIYFEGIFGKPFPKSKPKFLATGPRAVMELDGFCEELQLAFEHHGEQHYRRVPRFQPSENDFLEQQRRDAAKIDLCRTAGVTVIEIPAIPELTAVDELPNLVKTKLAEVGIKPPLDPDIVTLDLSRIYDRAALKGLRQIAKSKGGGLLSETYMGDRGRLRWRCHEGHEWLANPNGIKNGHWCALCYGNVRKTLDEMREKAAQRGFTLLSDEYKGTNAKLGWQCHAGHVWQATPNKLFNQGTGCPSCAGQNKTIEDMQVLAKTKGGQCLSSEYQSATVKLRWRCAKGHEFDMTPNYVVSRQDDWCPFCREEARRLARVSTRMVVLQEVVENRGGQVIDGEYREPHSKFAFQCSKGHQWITTCASVVRGSWCMQCYQESRQPGLTPG